MKQRLRKYLKMRIMSVTLIYSELLNQRINTRHYCRASVNLLPLAGHCLTCFTIFGQALFNMFYNIWLGIVLHVLQYLAGHCSTCFTIFGRALFYMFYNIWPGIVQHVLQYLAGHCSTCFTIFGRALFNMFYNI